MMKFPYQKKINCEEDTVQVANEFADYIKNNITENYNCVTALNGNLGAGKTYFVKKFSGCFNINSVNSPTFSIVNEYIGEITVQHFDFYRINKVDELYDIGFQEYLMNDNTFTFIEWAELFPELLPANRFEIDIKLINQEQRELTIRKIADGE